MKANKDILHMGYIHYPSKIDLMTSYYNFIKRFEMKKLNFILIHIV